MKKNLLGCISVQGTTLRKTVLIMKWSFAFLFLFCMQVSAKVHSQTKLTLKLEKASLSKVFLEIEKKTQFRFLFDEGILPVEKNVDVNVNEEDVNVLLSKVLKGTGLIYHINVNDLIIISSGEEIKTDDFEKVDKTVKGKVANTNGEPLGAASVVVKGTKTGVQTDTEGNFSIIMPDGKSVLVISSVGYESQEVTVVGTSVPAIKLQADNTELNAVVVTGYTKQSKRDVTGAVSTVSADVVAKTPVADIGSVLQGRVAGVSVDAQGGPGSTAVVRIRGFGSNGNNDVLYVIDGVQIRGGSNLVNPNDIETITVLKDPSNTALYGAQGGNGVIVVTTKSGKRGAAPKLEYNAYGAWESPTNYPKSLSPMEYANAYRNYLVNSNLPLSSPGNIYGTGATPILPDYIVERTTSPTSFTAAEGSPEVNPSLYNLSSYRILKLNKEGTDWFRSVLGNNFSHSHQLTLSGATDKSNYSLGLGYLNNEGTLLATYFTRYSFRVNTEFRPAKWLKIGENAQFSYTKGSGVSNHTPQGILADLYQRSPLIPIYDIAGNYSGPKGIVDGISLHPGGNNPVLGQKSALDNGGGYNAGLISSAFVAIEPIKNLVLESKVGVQFYPYSFRYFIDTVPQNLYSQQFNSFTEGGGYSSNLRWTNKLSYDVRIGNAHKVSAFVAYESSRYDTRNNSGTTPNLLYTTPGYLNLGNGTIIDTGNVHVLNGLSGGSDAARTTSVFGNVNYTLLDKYLVGFVARRDGSSKFGPLSRYGNFYSASGGWRLSNEKFLENVKWLSDLKLRAAYGENGNDAIPSFLYEDRYLTREDAYSLSFYSYDINGTNNSAFNGAGLSQLGNPYIHWETNKTTNLGFDAALFKNKVTVSLSWFNRVTKDLLAVPPVSGLRGDALAPYENIMKFSNKGFELELGYNNKLGQVNYDMNFNISTYKNNVDYISNDPKAFLPGGSYGSSHFDLTRSVVGMPVSTFFGYVQEGIFQSGDEFTKNAVAHKGLTAANAAGHFKFKDLNSDGKINEDDRTFLGNPHPKFSYGYNVNVNYKNVDLGIFVQGVSGNKIFNYWRASTVFPGKLGEGANDTWSSTNTGAKLPIWDNVSSDDASPSSFFIEDGSYFRLKSVQLGYTIPASKAFNKIRLYIQAYNLATISKYNGIDPEISTGNATNIGIDFGGNYPISKKFVFGINLVL